MSSLLALLFHPVETLDRWFEYDGRGVEFFYPLTAFFAFGIWLVFDRYNRMHNSAVPFEWKTPDVCGPFYTFSTRSEFRVDSISHLGG